MVFLTPHGSFYVKIQEVNISTYNKTDATDSDLQYEIALNVALRDVISVTLAGYSFPSNIFPSFYNGNDTLDFSLQDGSINGGNPSIFSVTLPHRKMGYGEFLQCLKTLMREAVSANILWTSVEVDVFPGELFQTVVTMKGVTSFTLLFDTGPNRSKSVYQSLGFPSQSDVVSSSFFNKLNETVQAVESPFAANLSPFKYIDIFIDEMGQEPVKRIFANDETYVTNYFQNTRSLDVITNNVPRLLDKLHVRVAHDSVFPQTGSFPHALTLHVASLPRESTCR